MDIEEFKINGNYYAEKEGVKMDINERVKKKCVELQDAAERASVDGIGSPLNCFLELLVREIVTLQMEIEDAKETPARAPCPWPTDPKLRGHNG